MARLFSSDRPSMRRWNFSIVVDLEAHALLRVLQPFAVLSLRPDWLLLSDQGDSFAITTHFDNMDDEIAARLVARLQQMACVRLAGASVMECKATLPPQMTAKPH